MQSVWPIPEARTNASKQRVAWQRRWSRRTGLWTGSRPACQHFEPCVLGRAQLVLARCALASRNRHGYASLRQRPAETSWRPTTPPIHGQWDVSQVRFRANLFSEGATTQDVSSRRWQRTRAPDSSQRSPCPTETSTGFCGSALTRNLKVESQTLHIRFTLRNRHPERLDQTLPTRTRETLARRITAR